MRGRLVDGRKLLSRLLSTSIYFALKNLKSWLDELPTVTLEANSVVLTNLSITEKATKRASFVLFGSLFLHPSGFFEKVAGTAGE